MSGDLHQISDERRWHLDKKVPIALILALLAQTAAGVWWAASMDSRQAEQERRITAIEKAASEAISSRESVTAKMAAIETALKYQNDTLIEIKSAVRDLAQQRRAQ